MKKKKRKKGGEAKEFTVLELMNLTVDELNQGVQEPPPQPRGGNRQHQPGAVPAMSFEPSGGSESSDAGAAQHKKKRKKGEKKEKKSKKSKKKSKKTKPSSADKTVYSYDDEWLWARHLTDEKVMKGAFKDYAMSEADVGEGGVYSYLMPGDKRLLFVPQDDPNGGKSKIWMKARRGLYATASKWSGSWYSVQYSHASVRDALRGDNCVSKLRGAEGFFETPHSTKLEDHSLLWKCLVTFRRVEDHFTDAGRFRMENGTKNEDAAILAFLRKFKRVFAAEEYLHIFNDSTREAGWSAGCSPDGILLWFDKRGNIERKTCLEVKCGSSCSNSACKNKRKKAAALKGKTIEDAGFFCTNKAHFKPHKEVKTSYTMQLHLEMLAANLDDNVYVSLGYDGSGNSLVNAFHMKFCEGTLASGVLYMRTFAEMKDLAEDVKNNEVYQHGANSASFGDMNADPILRDAFLEALVNHLEYDPLLARLHYLFETMERWCWHACMGAHETFCGPTWASQWKNLDLWHQNALRNAWKISPLAPENEGSVPMSEKVIRTAHAELANSWKDPNVRHKKVDFESPDVSFMTPQTAAELSEAFEAHTTKDMKKWVAKYPSSLASYDYPELTPKDWLVFKTPQGVLSDEFRYCLNYYPNPLKCFGDEAGDAMWYLKPTLDDAVVELRLKGGAYSAHLRRAAHNNSYLNPVGISEKDSDYEEGSEYEEEEPPLSAEAIAALEILRRLESEDGITAQEWLVDKTPEERTLVVRQIAEQAKWGRIIMLPEDVSAQRGNPLIRASFVGGGGDLKNFDDVFPLLHSGYGQKPTWTFTKHLYKRKKSWEPSRKMTAPPHIGGYDDEGIYMNATGWLDDKLPASMHKIPRGARVKVVVNQMWDKSCNFHTILVHKEFWRK